MSIKKVPKKLIYFTVVFAGLVFTAIGDGGFIVLPPLAAIIFINIKKNPLIGIFLSFAGPAWAETRTPSTFSTQVSTTTWSGARQGAGEG